MDCSLQNRNETNLKYVCLLTYVGSVYNQRWPRAILTVRNVYVCRSQQTNILEVNFFLILQAIIHFLTSFLFFGMRCIETYVLFLHCGTLERTLLFAQTFFSSFSCKSLIPPMLFGLYWGFPFSATRWLTQPATRPILP